MEFKFDLLRLKKLDMRTTVRVNSEYLDASTQSQIEMIECYDNDLGDQYQHLCPDFGY